MTPIEDFRRHFAHRPIVAIIRGVKPDEVEAIGEALYEGGVRIIEVPLNSPDPLESIRRLSARMGERALVGAGTVLEAAQVEAVRAAGGRLIVSPNTDVEVIRASVAAGLVSAPGFFTPSEAFAAIKAGAQVLKLFPAEAASPAVVKAQLAVIPRGIPLLVVGGVDAASVPAWLDAGANGFGIASALYRPGATPAEVLAATRSLVGALPR